MRPTEPLSRAAREAIEELDPDRIALAVEIHA
jgi:hypothetical protein